MNDSVNIAGETGYLYFKKLDFYLISHAKIKFQVDYIHKCEKTKL